MDDLLLSKRKLFSQSRHYRTLEACHLMQEVHLNGFHLFSPYFVSILMILWQLIVCYVLDSVEVDLLMATHTYKVWSAVVHWFGHWTHDHKVVGSSPAGGHCIESISKTLNPHCSSPSRWKKKLVPASYLVGKVKQTPRRSSVPRQQNYTVDSCPIDKEIEVGTTAESLELRFQLHFFSFWRLIPKGTLFKRI